MDFLVELNRQLAKDVRYLIRLEPGIQTPEQTLEAGSGSCRDSGWLLVQLLRHLGIAARFVSGYLVQLKADVPSLDGPSGPPRDFTDLHAWCEAYLPGAGWVGLDATSGLLAGEGHIRRLHAHHASAEPVTEAQGHAKCSSDRDEGRARDEAPRVTKPLASAVERDERRRARRCGSGGARRALTMAESHLFRRRSEGPQEYEAMGPKRGPARNAQTAEGTLRAERLLHFGQGKWSPGEQLRVSLSDSGEKTAGAWSHPSCSRRSHRHGASRADGLFCARWRPLRPIRSRLAATREPTIPVARAQAAGERRSFRRPARRPARASAAAPHLRARPGQGRRARPARSEEAGSMA